MPAQQPNLLIKLVRSPIGYTERQKATVKALGLRRLHHEVERPDNGPIRGMIFKIQHLVEVRPAEPVPAKGEPAARKRREPSADEVFEVGTSVPPVAEAQEPAPEAAATPTSRRRARSSAATKENGDETA
jgi:large subunit ribosomal protein L30